ncbi:hypothetical protein UlMin_010981 [Ulmus minor]
MGGGSQVLYDVPLALDSTYSIPSSTVAITRDSGSFPACKAALSPNNDSISGQLNIVQGGIFGYICLDTTTKANFEQADYVFPLSKHSLVGSPTFGPLEKASSDPICFSAVSKTLSPPSSKRKKKSHNYSHKKSGLIALSPSKAPFLGRPPNMNKRKNSFSGLYAFSGKQSRGESGARKAGKLCIENLEKESGALEALPLLVGNRAFTNEISGLGNDWTFQILHDYVQQYCPPLVFLSETLCSKLQMERWRIKLGFTGMLIWEKEGRSGGLCLFWSDTISVQLLSGSKGHIDVLVTSHNSLRWRFTGLYGNPDSSLRIHFWNLLKRLGDSSSLPWLCGGDLNEILFNHEKQRGADRAHYLMSFRGPKFTWCRGKATNLIQERLDRMLGNTEWMDLFPNSRVHHLNLRGSDHRPLLIELLRADEFSFLGKSWKKGRFHFEEAWVDEAGCSNIIKEHWNSRSADSLDKVASKLRSCASDLEKWNLDSFRSLKYKEERYWKHRSKDTWLKCGDRNSKFFHQKASARHAKNSISGILDTNEIWCDTEQGMAQIIESYFETLFSSSSPSLVEVDRVLDTIDRKVTSQMNEQLDQVFGPEDVKEAVFQMAPTKSPGANGMSAIFYQSFWPVVGEEVTAACLGFTNRGLPLGNINETIITLLPKIKNPVRITEFWPISLCNVLYKIISKMLANRLRKGMDKIISQEQSAFIPGRLISDNAIIGFECLHAIKRRKTKKNYMALKLDMEKAYDRVEWDFI